MTPLLLAASLSHAQWHTTRIENDSATEAVVGVAIRQWGPTDEVFFAVEKRNISNEEHSLHLEKWECLNASCSSAAFADGPDALFNELRHDQYMFPSMAVMREDSSAPRTLTVAVRDRKRLTCDGNSYALGGAFDRVVKFLDVNSDEWDTDSGNGPGDYPVRLSDTSDNVCEDSQRTYARYDKFTKDVHVAYDWDETPDVYGGATPIPVDVFISNRALSSSGWDDTLVFRNFGENLSRYHPQFDFDDNADRIAVMHEVGSTLVEHVDVIDAFNNDVAFPVGGSVLERPSISVQGDRTDVVDSDGYHTCTTSPSVDCRDAADWTTELLSLGDDAAVESDGDRLFILYGSTGTVQMRSKCVGDPSWVIETPKSPTGSNKQMTFSGRPSMVINKNDNVLHVALVENSSGLANESDGAAWWARRSYSDCP